MTRFEKLQTMSLPDLAQAILDADNQEGIIDKACRKCPKSTRDAEGDLDDLDCGCSYCRDALMIYLMEEDEDGEED